MAENGNREDADRGPASERVLPRRTLMSGELVFEEGDLPDGAYLIQDGEVEIFRVDGVKQMNVATLGRGDIFGELSLIDGKPRAACARAISASQLLVIGPEDMAARMAQLGNTDKVLHRLIGIFVDRLRGQLSRLV